MPQDLPSGDGIDRPSAIDRLDNQVPSYLCGCESNKVEEYVTRGASREVCFNSLQLGVLVFQLVTNWRPELTVASMTLDPQALVSLHLHAMTRSDLPASLRLGRISDKFESSKWDNC